MPAITMTEELQRQYDTICHTGAERAILGIAMTDPDTLFDIASTLAPVDFHSTPNRHIYQIMLTILDNKYSNIAKVNPMVIHTVAQHSGIDESIGGMHYIQMISKTDAGSENLQFFIDKVKQASVRRESFVKGLSVMSEAVEKEEEDSASFISRQEEKFLDLVMSVENSDSQVVKVGDVIDIVLEKRENQPRELLGVPTGFAEYDRATGGLVPSRLKVVAATPKTGKSAHAVNVAMNISKDAKVPVLYIDTEMPTEEQIDRMIANLTVDAGLIVPERLVSSGMYSRNQKMKAVIDDYAKPIIKGIPFYHVYMPEFSPDKIYNVARKFQRQNGITYNGLEGQFVLIFDYIKIDEDSHKKNLSEYLVLGQITNMLKNKIAGLMGIPVLAYAQVNPRTGYGAEEINSSHMSGSNRIVMYVNELSFLTKKTDDQMKNDGQDAGNRVWTLGENRNGGAYKGWIDYMTKHGITKMKEIRNVALEE